MSEDDRTSNSDADSDDLAEKIKWFFLNIEHSQEKDAQDMSATEQEKAISKIHK